MRTLPLTMMADSPLASPLLEERSASFRTGDLFYRPASMLIRDLGVLALAAIREDRGPDP